MSFQIDKRLTDIKPYTTLKEKLPIRLDVNESFINLPQKIIDDFKRELDQLSFNRYPDPFAADLCAAFAKFYNVEESLVVAGNGSDELINLIVEAFLSDKEKVLTLNPDFSMYSFYTWLRQGRIVSYRKKDDYYVDLNGVLAFVRQEQPKLVIFSNPCNPTGGIIPKSELIPFVERCDCLVVVDEAYMDFSDQSIVELVKDYDNLIVLKTMSKFAATASARIGFAVCGIRLVKVLKAIKSVYNINGISQILGRLIYEDETFLASSKESILKSKEFLYNELSAFETVMDVPFVVMPSFTNFVFIKTDKAEEIYKKLLDAGIAIRCFRNRLRINAGSIDENLALIKELKKYI